MLNRVLLGVIAGQHPYSVGPGPAPSSTILAYTSGSSPYYGLVDVETWSSSDVIPSPPALATRGVDFNPDRTVAAWVCRNGNVGTERLYVYNTSDWSSVTVDSETAYNRFVSASACRFSPSGEHLAMAVNTDPSLGIYRTSDWVRLSDVPTFSITGSATAWSPDGAHVLIGGSGSPYLYRFGFPTYGAVSALSNPPPAAVSGIEVSPDGTQAAVSVSGSSTEGLVVYNFPAMTKRTGFALPSGQGWAVSYSPDGAYLAFAHSAGVWVYDSATMVLVTGPSVTASCRSVAYSADGSYLAVGLSNSPYLRVFNTGDWTQIASGLAGGIIEDMNFN